MMVGRMAGREISLPRSALMEAICDYEMLLASDAGRVTYSRATVAPMLTRAAALVEEVADRYLIESGLRDYDDDVVEAEPVPGGPETLSGFEVVHPRESVRAALALFQAALPVLVRELPGGTAAQNQTAIALLLNQVITERLNQDLCSNVSLMLRNNNAAYLEERRFMARELHDRVAHTMSVALQSLELYDVYVTADADRAKEKLAAARICVHEALDKIRHMHAELRATVDGNGLRDALAKYLRAHVPASVEVAFVCPEDVSLPVEVGEELYLVMREAIRNAVLHSRPTALWVALFTAQGTVSASVRDNGVGFQVEEDPHGRHFPGGLTSMRERVELLGGRFVLKSDPDQGTTVEAHIPFVRCFP